MVDAISTRMPAATQRSVRRLEPRHSRKSNPQMLLKMMMNAMWSVQLEKSKRPICVLPIP